MIQQFNRHEIVLKTDTNSTIAQNLKDIIPSRLQIFGYSTRKHPTVSFDNAATIELFNKIKMLQYPDEVKVSKSIRESATSINSKFYTVSIHTGFYRSKTNQLSNLLTSTISAITTAEFNN